MKQTVVKLSTLCLIIGIGAYANAQSIEAVGVNTETPKETLDVNGTVKVQKLPENGTGKKYNGANTANAAFNATKTVVADADGVLGTVGFVIPKGNTQNNSLKWNTTNNQWEAKPGKEGAWLKKQTTDEVATKEDNKASNSIYYNGKIGIGDFRNRKIIDIDNGPNEDEAQLSIIGGGKNQLRLSNRSGANKTVFDISTESGGLTFINRGETAEWRTAYFLKNGSLVFGGHISNPGNYSGSDRTGDYTIAAGKSFYYDSVNGRIAIATGTGPQGQPTQTIDAGGTARLRQMPEATAGNSPVFVDSEGVLRKGNARTNSSGGSSPWSKDDNTPATNADLANNIFHTGNVGIGGSFTSNHNELGNEEGVKLSVKGAVLARSYRGANGAEIFPDYVFQKYYTGTSSIKSNYNFSTLTQVENFIKEKGHLPGYLSASEIKKQGYIDLMDTQITNVEKIEELYLHSIEQDKKLKEQAKEIKELKELIKKLVK